MIHTVIFCFGGGIIMYVEINVLKSSIPYGVSGFFKLAHKKFKSIINLYSDEHSEGEYNERG